MAAPLRVLIVEDSEDDAALMVRELRRHGYDLTFERVQTVQAMKAALDTQQWDVILSDYSMPSFNAPAALRLVQDRGIDIPFIIVSGTVGEETAVAAMKAGAHDFFAKNKLTRLVPAIERELQEVEGRRKRRWAEEQLRQSEDRFAKAFQAGPMGISIITINGIFIEVNDSFLQFSGYSRNEVIGHTTSELDFGIDSGDGAHTLQIISEGRTVRDIELRFRTKSGELRDALSSFAPIHLGGETCVLSMFQDITERKRMEQELLEAERMRIELEKQRELVEMKEEFIATVSHDFRTPLTVIVTSSDMLIRYQGRLPAERMTEHLTRIGEQARYMTDLLDDVLQFSKARAGKLEVHPSAIQLEQYCKTLFEQFQVNGKPEHRFLFSASGQLNDAFIDEKILQRVLVNLISNAIKYSPDGGEIRFDLFREGENVVFRISDQGIGIPFEDQQHIFQPFQRASNTHDIEGTGLGMAIVHQNLNVYGGLIEMESQPGKGSIFTVRLPYHLRRS